MSLNIAGGFEKLEDNSRVLALGSGVARFLSETFGFPAFVGDVFGFFTKVGLLGRATGFTGRKVSE